MGPWLTMITAGTEQRGKIGNQQFLVWSSRNPRNFYQYRAALTSFNLQNTGMSDQILIDI